MHKDPNVFLEHIIESIELIEEYTDGASLNDFMISTRLQDLVLRRLEIIGEAVKYLPDDFREKNSKIEWKKIAGMRDIIIHQYFGVDLKLTWNVVQNELPALKDKIKRILNRNK